MKWLLPRRKAGLRQSNIGPRIESVHDQKFDEATGQIYTEETASIRTSDDRDWTRLAPRIAKPLTQDRGDYNEYLRVRETGSSVSSLADYEAYLDRLETFKVLGVKGARSLQTSAIECILENISDVTLEGIECLPRHIIRRVWHAASNKRSIISRFN